jgi:acetylornithine deacetylase/succinyl-diaminopimelate desuccinylase-like protein
MNEQALQYAQNTRDRFLEELKELLRIPSISTLPEYKDDIARAAQWLAEDMKRIGMDHVQVYPTDGHPVVYGEWMGAKDAPTVLVYGHYDVQPVDPLNEWESPPFEPAIRDGKIYARGASDNKGQAFAHVKAVEAYLKGAGGIPVNVKLILEGEEEIGSPNLEPFVIDHKNLLAADSGLVSDSRIISPEQPSILYGLRGLLYTQIDVRGPDRDLHSGTYGGSVHNPAQALAEIITALHDETGYITIPGFYDSVRQLPQEEREALSRVPYPLEQWQEETGLQEPWGEPEYTLIERMGARPTCEVNGIWGGFQGAGGKTIIPAEAGAKISMRLVPDQDPQEIAKNFTDYIHSIAPSSLEVDVTIIAMSFPAMVPLDAPEMKAASQAYETVWGVAPVYTREGGSIPIVATFQRELSMPVILMGFGLSDNVHSPNEHFRVDHFYKGIDTIIHYYRYISQQPR